MVANFDELEILDASEIPAQRLNGKEFFVPSKGEEFTFPSQMEQSSWPEEIGYSANLP